VPNAWVIVRGGTRDLPPAGTAFSGAAGADERDAAAGVPQGTVRTATAAAIRAAGGMILVRPERTRSGTINWRHVDVVEGAGGPTAFGPLHSNPVPKPERVH
jgi:hypothetical protein